jgi:S1-C subfamily serine protease
VPTQQWAGGGQPPVPPPPGGPGLPPPAPKRKRTGLIVGAIAAVAVVGGGVAFVATQGDDEKGTEPTVVTTVPTSATTGTTTPPEPLDSNRIAKSVVEIWATMSDGTKVWHGSGTILSPTGLILTNAHVVSKAPGETYDILEIHITESADNAPTPMYQADVVGFDPTVDLATVQIARDLEGNPVTVDGLPYLEVGDSDAVQLGDHLRVFGYPAIGGDTITLSEGSVSGFTNEAGIEGRAWVKSDATIAGGVSGGTAVNEAGELVAIPTRAVGSDTGDATDCRRIQDTNGDGSIDQADSCIPIGGFINGLRPVNLAAGVIAQGELGELVSPELDPVGPVDTSEADFSSPVFSYGVNDDDTPAEVVLALPSGSTELCGFFDWVGMPEGTPWSALWYINGELSEGGSTFEQAWNGGPEGSNWWVCINFGGDTLPDGLYELILQIDGNSAGSNTVWVGDSFVVNDLEIVNNTGSEVCYLYLSPTQAQNWGPDELGVETKLPAGGSVTIQIVGEIYWVLAEDCDHNTIVEIQDADLISGGTFLLSQ